jgi:transposase
MSEERSSVEAWVANTPEELASVVATSNGTAKLAIEATSNWGYIYDVLESRTAEVVLAHPLKVKAISSAKVKTDKIDSDTLAHLLRADLIPVAYIPRREVRDQRDWLLSRSAVVWMAAQLKNRIHAFLARNGLASPVSDLFGNQGSTWLAGLELRSIHRGILDRYLYLFDALQTDI